ncbi:MAG: O-methyltransferase [Bacteroidales bacterium]|jgi:caffeoyl-CoA O-methyltransferase|nr:O-methyltransferase [Bacteroidales bacterium]
MKLSTEIEKYIHAHIDEEPEILQELKRQAHLTVIHPRMVSGHLQGRILKTFMRMIRPRHVLEIGTYLGYSALCIAEGIPENATIDTIEINDELEHKIQHFFSKSAHAHKIQLHIGNAIDIITNIPYDFDLVFIDGNKRHYIDYYNCVFDKIPCGGFIIADNTLWDGHVIEEESITTNAQTKGIVDFNEYISHDPRVEKVILPIRDGLSIIEKIKNS